MSRPSRTRPRATAPCAVALLIALAAAPAAAQDDATNTADVVLVKSDANDPVNEGDLVSYGVNVTNLGPADATGIVIIDQAPAGWSFEGGAPACEATTAPNVVRCEVPETLAPNGSIAYLLSFRTSGSGTFTNRADVTADQPDPDPANNGDSEDTRVLGPDEQVPAAPDNFTCRAEGEDVLLRWTPVDGVGGPDGGYNVYRRAAGETDFTLLTTTNASRSSHLDETTVPGVTYDYRLTAFDAAGEGPAASCTVTAIPFFPGGVFTALAAVASVGAALTARRWRAR